MKKIYRKNHKCGECGAEILYREDRHFHKNTRIFCKGLKDIGLNENSEGKFFSIKKPYGLEQAFYYLIH